MGGICNQFSVAQWRKLRDSNRTVHQGQWFKFWQKGKTYFNWTLHERTLGSLRYVLLKNLGGIELQRSRQFFQVGGH